MHKLFQGFPGGSDGEASACNEEDLGSIPGLRRSSGEGKGYPILYSGLENFVDCIVHGVAKSQKRLSDFHSDVLFLIKMQIFSEHLYAVDCKCQRENTHAYIHGHTPPLHIHRTTGYEAHKGFSSVSVVKNLLANAGDAGLIPGSRRFPGEGNNNPF